MAKLWIRILVCLGLVLIGAVGTAHAHDAVHGSRTYTPPSHFSVGDQYFDGGIGGLRAYLATIRDTEPDLYAKLAPDVERMNERLKTAALLLGAGVVVGLGTTVYGIATKGDCVGPTVTDPDFAAKMSAWGACNDRGMQHMIAFTGIGLGALLVGGITAMAIAPGRSDYFGFVNRHNSLSPRPMRFELGYDPARRFALAGATFSF